MSGQFHISNFGNNITEVGMIALILLALVLTSRAHDHGHSHRPSSSREAFPTPTITIPAPVRMLNPQPAAHEIKCPVPEQNSYYTGWPTNVWMYPISQPSLGSVPSDSPNVKSRFPVVPIAQIAPTSQLTSKPSTLIEESSVPFVANTSLPSALPAHLPAPHRSSSAPSAGGASTLCSTSCTDTPAPSSALSGAPNRPAPRTPSSTPPPTTIPPSNSQAPSKSPSRQITENPTTSVDNVRTEQPTIMPDTRITATPTTAETAPIFLVSSTQPSAVEISSAPSASARSSRPSNGRPPAPTKSTTPSYVSFSPSQADSSMTMTPSASFPSFEVTYSVAPAAEDTTSPSSDILPRTPVPTAVQPTIRTTEMPSAHATNKEPSAAPTIRAATTTVPSANPGHSSAPSGMTPQSSQLPVRSASPISSMPISTVTVQPSIKSTQSVEPTALSTGAPHDTQSPSFRQSEAPIVSHVTRAPSRRPTSARTPSPTATILSPVSTLFPTQTPTLTSTTESSTPVGMATSFAPSAALSVQPSSAQPLTVNPTPSPTTAYMLLNTTLNAVLANMTTSNAELSQLEKKCIEDGVLASLVSLLSIIHSVRVDARQAQAVSMHTFSTSDSWNLTVVTTLNTSQNNFLNDFSALQQAFNTSIYSGLLQYNTRAVALAATPPVTSMIMVVFCAEEGQTRCLAGVIPAVPAADRKISACNQDKQESTEWNALYNSPGIIPWYLVWTMVLMTGWIIIAAWATTNIQWRTIYVTAAFCAHARVVYFALLLVHHFSHYSYSERLSLACIEFAYLDANNNDQIHLTWTIILTRSLFYPLLLLLGCQLVRNYWTCRDTRDTIYPMLATLVALCALSLCVSYVVLLIAHTEPSKHGLNERTAAVVAIGAAWAVQLLCGVLIFLQGVRLWIGCLTHTSARRLSDVYGDPLSTAVADTSYKHSSIEAKSTYRDLHCSSVQYLNPHEAVATENAFERSTAAYMRVVIAILITSAALVVVTTIPQALTTAIAAFVLYSVLARVTEILLVIAILHKSIDMRVFLHAQDDHGFIPEHSILSSTHDYDIPHINNATGNAPPLPCRQVLSLLSLGPQHSVNTENQHKNNHNEALPSCSDLTEQSNIDRTVWNKKWPWVATPSKDIAVQVAEHVHNNNSAILHSQPLQLVAGDSGSEDSTDSSGTYFV